MTSITIDFESKEDASFAAMFLRRCGYSEFFDRTEPHLSAAERAYRMRDAIGRIEKAFEEAGVPASIY